VVFSDKGPSPGFCRRGLSALNNHLHQNLKATRAVHVPLPNWSRYPPNSGRAWTNATPTWAFDKEFHPTNPARLSVLIAGAQTELIVKCMLYKKKKKKKEKEKEKDRKKGKRQKAKRKENESLLSHFADLACRVHSQIAQYTTTTSTRPHPFMDQDSNSPKTRGRN